MGPTMDSSEIVTIIETRIAKCGSK